MSLRYFKLGPESEYGLPDFFRVRQVYGEAVVEIRKARLDDYLPSAIFSSAQELLDIGAKEIRAEEVG